MNVTNNIFEHPAHSLGNAPGAMYPYVNTVTTNNFYSPNEDAGWAYDGVLETYEEDYLQEAGNDMSFWVTSTSTRTCQVGEAQVKFATHRRMPVRSRYHELSPRTPAVPR